MHNFAQVLSLTHKIAGIGLTAVMALASTGLVINSHYCQNQLKSKAFFVHAEACHSPKVMKACPMHPATQTTDDSGKNDCCDDRTDLAKPDIDQMHSVDYIDLDDVKVWPCAGFDAPQSDEPYIAFKTKDYLNYKPPLLVCNTTIVLQTFLC